MYVGMYVGRYVCMHVGMYVCMYPDVQVGQKKKKKRSLELFWICLATDFLALCEITSLLFVTLRIKKHSSEYVIKGISGDI